VHRLIESTNNLFDSRVVDRERDGEVVEQAESTGAPALPNGSILPK